MRGRPLSGRPLSGRPLSGRPLRGWGRSSFHRSGGGPSAFSPLSLAPFIWLDPSDLSTLFQDSGMTTPVTGDGEIVGAILDKSGNGHHLLQAFHNNKPLYRTAGGLHWLEFDGVDDLLMLVTFTAPVPQPLDRVSGIRQIAWVDGGHVFGSGNSSPGNDGGYITQATISPRLHFFDGGNAVDNDEATVGADVVLTERHAGVSSRLSVDNGAYATGNPGTDANDGLTIGARFSADQCANIRFYGLTQFDRLLLDPEIAQLRTYLAAKQGRVL